MSIFHGHDDEILRLLETIQRGQHQQSELEAGILIVLEDIRDILQRAPTGIRITQLSTMHEFNYVFQYNPQGDDNMSTPAGGTSTFQMAYTPVGSVAPAGTTQTWTVDDTADITLTPSPDGTQCTAVCSASPTGTSYNLTCTSSYTPPGATTPISATINVPIVTVPPAPTGMTITQLS